MLLAGCAPESVLRLSDVDMGLRRVRVTGKGGKERVVPVTVFRRVAAYEERPAACFVVLRGPPPGSR